MTPLKIRVLSLVLRKILPLLVALPLFANDLSYRTLQSGSPAGPTPLSDHGLNGSGQTIAILDTGLDVDSCYFAGKVVAYDLLEGEVGDNQGHGTHAAGAAAGDRGAKGFHDSGDSIANGARLVIQDAGFTGGDGCSQRPGLGCPVRDLRPILQQAYDQGARIHSNSWGDRQGIPYPLTPPTGNYNQTAAQIDDFVYNHPDLLVIFNSGNAGQLGASSISAPGTAKNTIQVGGTRSARWYSDEVLSAFSGKGPTRDGRFKPELVGPAYVMAGDTDLRADSDNCNASMQGGTSWSAPTIAAAAALVRQYLTDGFYPSGTRRTEDRMASVSAALVKALLIAAARPVLWREDANDFVAAAPAPSFEQGFGFPVLDDALYFQGESRRLKIVEGSVASSQSAGFTVSARKGSSLKAVLVWSDPPSTARSAVDPTPVLVHDLDLSVLALGPSRAGARSADALISSAASPDSDRLNNVETARVESAADQLYRVQVSGFRVGAGARQPYAVVLVGDFEEVRERPRPARR